jgi:hypothetical protein
MQTPFPITSRSRTPCEFRNKPPETPLGGALGAAGVQGKQGEGAPGPRRQGPASEPMRFGAHRMSESRGMEPGALYRDIDRPQVRAHAPISSMRSAYIP